ncbi:MAG TPA: zinc ribbon domain-containing protein [Methylophaga aminisulfidivorans]|uniref:Zinc ribbon domain-containing protein n=1 Tax=Methylophaga aminisulfidivorans TaxID=230105 RepID=A0A7C2AH45_9GAMM|nr:zinc ribbon domain-containing protein [Methylophaga aminisulfidivorans]
MPIYDYRCEQCGEFSALRKMSESSLPCTCESCGEQAPRIISAPNLALMNGSTRSAHERNEKSAHAPRQARRSSCGCSGSHTCSTSNKDTTSTNKQEGNGLLMQTKKTARPWMLGH